MNVNDLNPRATKTTMSSIKGRRTRHVVTLNPNKVNPNETLHVDIPKLKPDSCLVPGSLHLLFDFKNANAKSWYLNNLSKLLQSQLTVKMAGEVAYDNIGESSIEVYKDLWRPTSERSDMTEYGISNLNLRKLISKDDTGAKSGDVAKVSDGLVFAVQDTKQKISLDKILGNSGLYAPFSMCNNIQYLIKFPIATDIMVAQSGSAVEGYSLENLELEYETVENADLAGEITSLYMNGRSLPYEHVTLMTSKIWGKDETLINESVNLPRKSMKAVVLLFTPKVVTDSEEFVYPNIESVKVTVEGVPNEVYSQGIPKLRFYEEAKRMFGQVGDNKEMTLRKFYKSHFALVVDLRSTQDNSVHGTGKRILNTQSGILLEIKKKATTADLVCKMFVLSDAFLNIMSCNIQSVSY